MRFFLPFISSWLGRQEQVQSEPPEPCTPPDICYSPPELWEIEFEHDPNMRTQSLCQPCKTVAYPSAGGIVLGFFSAVELIYLNISRTETTKRSTDPAEEDDLATRMLKLGAYWWPSWEVYARHQAQINDNITYDYLFPPVLNVGYPQMSSGGGVWVLKFSADQQTWDPEDMRKPYLERMPEDWPGSMDLVMTMDERCAVLKRFGATFYEKVEDCPDIAQSLPEAIQRGMRYAELLSKMNDVHYMCRWLDGPGIPE